MIALTLALLTASPAIETYRASPQAPMLVLARDPNASTAALHVIFRAGAADDGLEEGLTHMSQYALLHGQDAARFAAFDAALYGADATLDVDTSVRECSFTVTAPKAAFDGVAARVLKQLLAPKVGLDGVERARRLAATDMLQIGSRTWVDAYVAASVLVTEGVAGGGDYNNPIWGDPDTIRKIPAASVVRHVRQHFAPANAVVIVTGAFDPKRMKAMLAPMRGGAARPLRRPEILPYLPFERDVPRSPREMHLQLQVVDASDAASSALVHVLAAYLHDRLFFKLRKSGHVYSPGVMAAFHEWLDFILVAFTVTPGGDKDLRNVMMDEIAALATGKVDEASLARARAIAGARLAAVERSPREYAWALEPLSRNVVTVGPDVRAAVANVDGAALADAGKRFLPASRAVSFIFGATRRAAPGPKPQEEP